MLKLLQSVGWMAFPAIFAAVCVLFATVPSQAEDDWSFQVRYENVTATVDVTVAADGTATLSPSITPPNNQPLEVIGFQFQDREGSVAYGDDWWIIGSGDVHYIDRDYWLTSGPYYVRVRVWKVRNEDGEWSSAISEPGPEVEVVLPPE